jgi:hypothetical protein
MDAPLEGVHEEDRLIIENVVAAMEDMKLFTSWTCDSDKGCYVVTGHMIEAYYELSPRELDMLRNVSPLRVMSIQRPPGENSLCVKVSSTM